MTNPPYDRRDVDKLAWRMHSSVEARTAPGLAMLMRSNWQFAARRTDLFFSPLYRGQTCMQFRPWWTDDRKARPIHSFVWHVWSWGSGEPVLRFWPLQIGLLL